MLEKVNDRKVSICVDDEVWKLAVKYSELLLYAPEGFL